MSNLSYYFASWEDDSDDIFELMEEWWKVLPVKDIPLDIDKSLFKELYESSTLVTICARNELGELVSCFVGQVVPYLLQRGKTQLTQLAACFKDGYRNPINYLCMINTIEEICKKLSINIFNPSTNQRMADIMIKRKDYTLDSTFLIKEIK